LVRVKQVFELSEVELSEFHCNKIISIEVLKNSVASHSIELEQTFVM